MYKLILTIFVCFYCLSYTSVFVSAENITPSHDQSCTCVKNAVCIFDTENQKISCTCKEGFVVDPEEQGCVAAEILISTSESTSESSTASLSSDETTDPTIGITESTIGINDSTEPLTTTLQTLECDCVENTVCNYNVENKIINCTCKEGFVVNTQRNGCEAAKILTTTVSTMSPLQNHTDEFKSNELKTSDQWDIDPIVVLGIVCMGVAATFLGVFLVKGVFL